MIQEDFDNHEVCAVCGKDADGNRWFCHFYDEQKRITLCSPTCAEAFMHPAEPVGVATESQPWDDADVPRIAL